MAKKEHALTGRKQSPETIAKRLATIKATREAKLAAKAALTSDPGRADAIVYLRHAMRWLKEHAEVEMDKAHLLGQLALKSLQGE